MAERIHCEWAEPSADIMSQYHDEVRAHADHGDYLERCDAWVCVCGNTPHRSGFFPCDAKGNALEPDWDGQFVFCDQCRRLIDRLTGDVVGHRVPEARDRP